MRENISCIPVVRRTKVSANDLQSLKNSKTALIFHPFHGQNIVVVVLGECSEENDHFGTTLLCGGGGEGH